MLSLSELSLRRAGWAWADRPAALEALRGLLAPVSVFLAVAALGAADGGYYATAWGWSVLAFAWVAGIALMTRERIGGSRLEVVFLAGLAGYLGWIACSLFWTVSVPQTVLELERGLVYVSGVAAFLLIARHRTLGPLLGGLFAGVTLLCTYSLATRLFPERFPGPPPIAGYRLAEPIGYWNALGLLAALGLLLALGFAARARSAAGRALASGTLVIFTLTLYFTFSRGAWIALALAILGLVALDPRRLQLLATMLVLAPAPALAVALAAGSPALTRLDARAEAAAAAGHRLAAYAVAIALAAAAVGYAAARLQRRVRVSGTLRVGFAAALGIGATVLLVGVFARYGGPVTLVRSGYDAFNAPPPVVEGSLNERLFSFSGSGRFLQWKAAWGASKQDTLTGSGPGTFEQHWNRSREVGGKVRDAHSLYLETLAELGLVGLALVLGTLAVPLAAAVRARSDPLVPPVAGAYGAWLVHAGVDWDWELPGVTLPALLCGAWLLVACRTHKRRPRERTRAIGIAALAAVAAVAAIGLAGNRAIGQSEVAIASDEWTKAAAAARRAMTWAPWSPEPWRRLGQSQIARNKLAAGEANLRRAIAKDPENWELWFDLALGTVGKEQSRALARALELNPLSPEIAEFTQRVIEPRRAKAKAG